MKKSSVPQLRFEDFGEVWKKKTLESISEKIQDGTHFSPSSIDAGSKLYLTSKNIRPGYLDLSDVSYISDDEHAKIYKRCNPKFSDVLLTKDGASTGNCCQNSLDFEFSLLSSVAFIRAKKDVSTNDFIFQIISSSRGQKEIAKSVSGQAITRITLTKLRNYKFYLPTLPEQQKIAAFLTAVDGRLQALRRQRELLEAYKRGVMQRMFAGEIKFGNGKWKEVKLSEVLHEHKARSNGSEAVHSVSVHKGVINQIEHLGRSFSASNTDHYNRVKPGDIVYTKSPTGDFPYGIIKQSRLAEDVIVSPLYGVFTPETENLGYILDEYFSSPVTVHNYLHPIIQKGAKNTINITNKTFLSNQIRLPRNKEEQLRIARFLRALSDRIVLVERQSAAGEAFKRGLLQQMFV